MKIQDKALSIGKYGCLAFCYLYCLGIEDDKEMIRCIVTAINEKLLDSECTVLDASKFLEYFSGRRFNVIKKEISSIEEIENPTPVKFSNGITSHWVVVENGKIVFNSLENSNSVNNGKPISARVISMA